MNKVNQEMIDALNSFKEAAATLSVKWDNFGGDDLEGYPFEKAFDDVVEDINQWCTNSVANIKNALYENNENVYILNRGYFNIKKGTLLLKGDDVVDIEYYDMTNEMITGNMSSYYNIPDEFITLASRDDQYKVSEFLDLKNIAI